MLRSTIFFSCWSGVSSFFPFLLAVAFGAGVFKGAPNKSSASVGWFAIFPDKNLPKLVGQRCFVEPWQCQKGWTHMKSHALAHPPPGQIPCRGVCEGCPCPAQVQDMDHWMLHFNWALIMWPVNLCCKLN